MISNIRSIGLKTTKQWYKNVNCSAANGILNARANKRWYSDARNDYYTLFPKTFGSESTPFAIDSKNLRREFLEKQAQIHPDKANSLNISRQDLEVKSSLLNTAYRTLTNPLKRAEHLLEQQGIEALAERETLVDEDLLMDVLMTREAISDLTSESEWKEIKQENDNKISTSERILTEAFNKKDFDTARLETIKLSYWMNIDNHLREMEGEVGQ